ncbi:MAG: DJ-1/PfpI family protein [Patescibacteria group bacterium]
MAKILFVIAKEDFKDEEYFIPKEILGKAGHLIKTASNLKAGQIAVGASGRKTSIDMNLGEINTDDFDVIIFIGGPGAIENLDNENSYNLSREAFKKKKLVSAICIAPVILAKAGILQGKKATVWNSPIDRSPIDILESNGANYTRENVVEDGNIITACGPLAAAEFGEKINKFLLSYKQ